MDNNVYMSLFSNDEYIYPIIALMTSWKNTHSKYPYYLLVTDNVSQESKDMVKHLGFNVIEIPEWQPRTYKEMRDHLTDDQKETFWQWHGKTAQDAGWQHTFSKFKAFDLTQFDKILLLDCDILMVRNLDYLFDYPTLASVSWFPENFCSGCMLISPNHTLYQALIHFADCYEKTNQGMPYDDYMVLKDFFSEWWEQKEHHFKRTSFYNLLDCSQDNHKKVWEWPKIDCIHMTGREKPWKYGYQLPRQWNCKWYCARMWWVYYLDLLNKGIMQLQKIGFNIATIQ